MQNFGTSIASALDAAGVAGATPGQPDVLWLHLSRCTFVTAYTMLIGVCAGGACCTCFCCHVVHQVDLKDVLLVFSYLLCGVQCSRPSHEHTASARVLYLDYLHSRIGAT